VCGFSWALLYGVSLFHERFQKHYQRAGERQACAAEPGKIAGVNTCKKLTSIIFKCINISDNFTLYRGLFSCPETLF
jgi:hypothetical protein